MWGDTTVVQVQGKETGLEDREGSVKGIHGVKSRESHQWKKANDSSGFSEMAPLASGGALSLT